MSLPTAQPSPAWSAPLWSAFALAFALLLTACEGCDGCASTGGPVLATLHARSGEVLRDVAGQEGDWRPAELGTAFRVGDGIFAGVAASAVLALKDGAKLQVPPMTQIRFSFDGAADDDYALDVETGEAVLTLGDRDLRLRTHAGSALLRAGSRVALSREGDGVGYRVELGTAAFIQAGGQQVHLSRGDAVHVGIGMAVLRVIEQDETPTDVEAEDATDAGVEADAGTPDTAGTPVNLAVPAGASFVLHAPEVPVSVGIGVNPACEGEGRVHVLGTRQRIQGRRRVALRLGAGVHRYALRCVDERGQPGPVVARGRVEVQRDAGTRQLPPKAPTSFVQADGRSYTVYYQNQLPNIIVRWPNAPHAPSYQLFINGQASEVDHPEHLLRSGTLDEGSHTLGFAAQGRKSRTTRLEIRFDNAAPKASVTSPVDRSFSAGETVRVEGVALPTWKVTAEGGIISMDASHRFFGEVVTTPNQPDVVLRLSHPRQGTHYYLRRALVSR